MLSSDEPTTSHKQLQDDDDDDMLEMSQQIWPDTDAPNDTDAPSATDAPNDTDAQPATGAPSATDAQPATGAPSATYPSNRNSPQQHALDPLCEDDMSDELPQYDGPGDDKSGIVV